MRRNSRLFLFIAMIVVLLTAACGADQGANPTTVVGTILPEGQDLTGTPFGGIATVETVGTAEGVGTVVGGLETATGTVGLETPTAGVTGLATATLGVGTQAVGLTPTAVVPVTGQDEIVLVECQFCVDTRAHALLVLPDTATFRITSPVASANTAADAQPTCTTVEVNNGRQVVLCSGPEMTPLVVNICTDPNTCRDFPVDLLACPLTQGGNVSPAQTRPAPGTGATLVAPTTDPGVVISTATPLGTITATPVP